RCMGLPAPNWSAIEVSDEFLEENPGLWFRRDGCPWTIKPLRGLHFGSRLIEAREEQCTYQMIPHSWINRIENRADFLGALILDLWANNCDRRQAVFLSDERNRLHASFVDNDFLFGGKFGNDTTCPRRAMVYDLDVYKGLWDDKIVQGWLGKVSEITETTIGQIIARVPNQWASDQMRLHIVEQLNARRSMLPQLLNDAKDVLSSGYSIQYHRSRYATEPGQFREAPILPLLR
ncbi:MAG: hypothetical protein WA400_03200, partial [Silvibacterium sp.]